MPREPKPWYRKDRDSWMVTVRGQRHNLGPDRKEALKRFYELMKEPATPRSRTAGDFVSLADGFLEWVRLHRAAPTFEWYRYRVERFCQRYPDLQLSDVRPYHVQQWVDSYEDLSQTSRRNYVRSIKRCTAWAKQQGYIDHDTLEHLEAPGAERREVFVTPEAFTEFMSLIPDPTLRELCQVTFETGCRPQESLRLESTHFDAVNERWVFPIKKSKGKRAPRVVYLTPYAVEVTKRLAKQNATGLLFRNRQGVAWSVSAVNCAFKRLQVRMAKAAIKREGGTFKERLQQVAAREYGVEKFEGLESALQRKVKQAVIASYAPKYSLYALRHGWATRALQSGLDPLTVAILMGHSDPSTLSRVYQHLALDPKHMLAQARRAQKLA